jgi:hypothetical protein
MLGTVRSAVARAFGIQAKDLGDDQAEAEGVIKKALELHNAKFSADTEDLRKQITELSSKHTQTLTEKEKEWQDKLTAAEQRYIDRDIMTAAASILKTIPRTGGDENVQARELVRSLREKYHLHWDDKEKDPLKALSLRKLDNKEAPALDATGTTVLSVANEAKSWAELMGLSSKDMRHTKPGGEQNNGGGSGGDGGGNGTAPAFSGSAEVDDEVSRLLA